MRKLILKCDLSPGDIVMLTAAVRDLHYWYPGRFVTDVRTLCPELWEHNPHLTPLREEDPEVEVIACSYPLIDRCHQAPCHCLQGFVEFLNERLGLHIKLTSFKGDIHLSPQEKAWYSQVYEVTGRSLPFWIVAAGGKHDILIKWWQTERYQAVVNHFQGRVQFVQVGQVGDHHPKLEGAIDLRGETTLRELVRLVYHAQGVLCSVTALMHLAAAVDPGNPLAGPRPCVVIAGGREPVHWEAYPGHQFIHTIGALPCCAQSGCWRDRTLRLRDGDPRDRPSNRCHNLVKDLPRCMHLITPEKVIERIELYLAGGRCRALTAREHLAAKRGVWATRKNDFDQAPLNLHSAGLACDRFVESIRACPARSSGRGIVICGGGSHYFACAWVCINRLRQSGCQLPIQLWHLGRQELDAPMRRLLGPLGVESIDALRMRRRFPVRILRGWELKAYALVHCRFQEVLLLDADNVPVANPDYLFDAEPYRAAGAVFWPDYECARNGKARAIWRSCGLNAPLEHEFETGQVLVDKVKCWPALRLSLWLNENSDFYYRYIHGDKETFHLAFRKVKQPYALVPHPIHSLPGTMCQHDFNGRRLFQHRNGEKWTLSGPNRRVRGFRFEAECLEHLAQLRAQWSGEIGVAKENR